MLYELACRLHAPSVGVCLIEASLSAGATAASVAAPDCLSVAGVAAALATESGCSHGGGFVVIAPDVGDATVSHREDLPAVAAGVIGRGDRHGHQDLVVVRCDGADVTSPSGGAPARVPSENLRSTLAWGRRIARSPPRHVGVEEVREMFEICGVESDPDFLSDCFDRGCAHLAPKTVRSATSTIRFPWTTQPEKLKKAINRGRIYRSVGTSRPVSENAKSLDPTGGRLGAPVACR